MGVEGRLGRVLQRPWSVLPSPSSPSPLTSVSVTASTFTPWFRLIAQSFLYKWWDALLASRKDESQPLDAKALIAEVEKEQATMGSIIRM